MIYITYTKEQHILSIHSFFQCNYVGRYLPICIVHCTYAPFKVFTAIQFNELQFWFRHSCCNHKKWESQISRFHNLLRSTIPAINIIESNHGPFHKGERNKPIFFVYYIYSGYLFWIMHPTTQLNIKKQKKLVKCDDESFAWNLLLVYFLIFSTIIFEIDIQI